MKARARKNEHQQRRSLRKAFAAAVLTVAVPATALFAPVVSDYTQPVVIQALVQQDVFPGLPGALSTDFNANAPKQTPDKWNHFVHGTPYYKYDSIEGVEYAAKQSGDRKAIDLDWHVTADGVVVNTHWSQPLESGFYDPLGLIDKETRVEDMTWPEVERLRTAEGYKIERAETMFALCAELGVRMEFEAKGSSAFDYVTVWRKLKDLADEYELTQRGLIQMKTLTTNGDPAEKLAAAHAVGFTTILLPRGSRELPKKDYWSSTSYVRGPIWWQ